MMICPLYKWTWSVYLLGFHSSIWWIFIHLRSFMFVFLKDIEGRAYCNWMSALSQLAILLGHSWLLALVTCLDSTEITRSPSFLFFTAWTRTGFYQPVSCMLFLRTSSYITWTRFYVHSDPSQNKTKITERTQKLSSQFLEILAFVYSFIWPVFIEYLLGESHDIWCCRFKDEQDTFSVLQELTD